MCFSIFASLFFFLFNDSRFSLQGFVVAEDVTIDVAFSFAMLLVLLECLLIPSHDAFASLVLLSQNIGVLVVLF
jgi:hypothetical protein